MVKSNLIILTGAPGSGKSTLLRLLRERGCACVGEPARQIISEQRAIGGSGVSDRNPALFIELMLSRAIARYQDIQDTSGAAIFDRGVADNIAYAALYSLPFDHGWAAAKLYKSNPKVFFAPNWQDIYATDEERTMTFEASAIMGDNLRSIYMKLGYEIIELPLSRPEDRLQFMFDKSPLSLLDWGGNKIFERIAKAPAS